MSLPPLIVDLDGSLIHADLLHESALRLVLERPLDALRMPVWLLRGIASLKHEIASRVALDVSALPYNLPLLDWLRAQRAQGRFLILATASNLRYAQAVADHLGLFDEIWASDQRLNLKGPRKAERAIARFGERGYSYVGNDRADLPVWQTAAGAVPVNAGASVMEQAAALAPIERSFAGKPPALPNLIKAMRLHQWLKNLLIVLPMFAAHSWSAASVQAVLLAGLAFCALASAIYLLNDMLDLGDDRLHPRKRLRPLAAGQLGLPQAGAAAFLLVLAAFGLASGLGPAFVQVLSAYLVLTLAYSITLKRLLMVDVLLLGALYTLRIVAGSAAIGVPLSFWLLAFSMSLFGGLALLKRYGELIDMRRRDCFIQAPGRGYHVGDIEMLASLGTAAAYGSVLILALYINSSSVQTLYRQPHYIWLACPALWYWIARAWMLAHRGGMHDDPVLFAVRDRTSWVLLLVVMLAFGLAV
ncbi:UbiA family prenyltransferase [Chitinimonas sp.]|uniref:UbiA family prenyltransferase n=1 Tax=Chitinimonas sp. TaxID=1934313 RepID=UPI0035B35316